MVGVVNFSSPSERTRYCGHGG